MKIIKILFLLLGVALLWGILRNIDLTAVLAQTSRLGWTGALVVLVLYMLTFLTDVAAWQLNFESVPFNLVWLRRLYLVRMIGEAFNNILPAASVGGEPIKALLLKSHYRINYQESGVSLVLAKTINMIGLVLFLGVGFILLTQSPVFPPAYELVAGAGLLGLTLVTAAFFLFQRLRVSSYAGGRLFRAFLEGRLAKVLHVIQAVDDQLVRFYICHRSRFAVSLILVISNWLLGVVEVYIVLALLGQPVSVIDAWIIEAMAQLVRSSTFFIPASLGAQEASFFFVCGAITGNPGSGLALSLVRRGRELCWIVAGLGLWGVFKPAAHAAVDTADPARP